MTMRHRVRVEYDNVGVHSFRQFGLGVTLVIVLSASGACGTGGTGTPPTGTSSASGTGGSGGDGAGGVAGAGGVPSTGGAAGMAGMGGAGGDPSGITEPKGSSLFIEVYDKVTGNAVADSWVGIGNDFRMTDAYGRVLFENLTPGHVVARILATNYVKSTVVADIDAGVHAGRTAHLLPLGESIQFDADVEAIVPKGNVAVTIPAGAFVDESGQPVKGMVEAHVVPIDPMTDDLSAMPGPLVGLDENGATPLASVFMADISFTQGGQQLQLAPGQAAQLEFVLPDAVAVSIPYGETIPAWWFDTYAGKWINEGDGIVQDSASQPGKLAWIATVRHFTTWNVDYPWTNYERNCYNVTVRNQFNTALPNSLVRSEGIDYYAWGGNPNIYEAMTSPNGGPACVETLVRKNSSYPFAQAQIYSPSGGTVETVTGQLPAMTCPNPACIQKTITITTVCNPGSTQTCPYGGPAGTQNNPPCKAGTRTCNATGTAWSACQGEVLPQPTDICGNNIDDNCNGVLNDGCMVCMPNSQESCYANPQGQTLLGTPGVGICQSGTRQCNAAGSGWGPCTGAVGANPGGEDCTTSVDDNCNGVVNEVTTCSCMPPSGQKSCYTGNPLSTQNVGECKSGLQACNAQGTGPTGTCNGDVTPVMETCGPANTKDENCNGVVNEGCAPFGQLYGDQSNQAGTTVSTNGSGEIFVGGWFDGQITFGATNLNAASTTMSDAFLAKLDSTGNSVLWARKYGDSAAPLLDQVIKDSVIDPATGHVYITGTFQGSIAFASNHTTTAVEDGFIAKINGATGDTIWSVKVGGAMGSKVTPLSIALGGDGNLVTAGNLNGSFPGCGGTCTGTDDMFIQKITAINAATPQTSWTRVVGGVGSVQEARGVAADTQGNVFITGKTGGSLAAMGSCPMVTAAGYDDAFIAKFDASGNCQWRQLYGDGGYNQSGTAIAAASNGDVVWVGSVAGGIVFPPPCGNYPVGSTDTDVFIARFTTNGACVFGRRITDNSTLKDQNPRDIAMDPLGNIALTGDYSGSMQWGPTGVVGSLLTTMGGSQDMFVARFLGDGTFQWVRSFGDTTVNQYGNAVAFSTSNSVVAVGEASGTVFFQGYMSKTSAGGSDVLLMKLNPGQ